MWFKYILISVLLSSVSTFDFTFSPGSIVLDETDDVKTACKYRKCIRKCCPNNQYFNLEMSICESFEGNFDYSNISVYDDYDYSKKIDRTLSEIFLLVPGRFFEDLDDESFDNKIFINNSYVLSDANIETYLVESGDLYLEVPNSYRRWYRVDYFCIEYEVGNTTTPKYWSILKNVPIAKSNAYFTGALLVSSVFLFIVLLVYILLPELRNLVGLILMAYIVSLMGAFLSLASLQLDEYSDTTCLDLTATTYFFFLATFSWMNVMSFDIWWTFRGYAKARPIHRRGEMFKFSMYCLYAWGVPLLMAVGLVVINNADLSHMPWFIKPQIPKEGCFLENGQKLVYLYVPMLILILCNWLLFLMTAFNVWRLSRGTSVLDSAAAGSPATHRKQKYRLMVYLKLSVIMGINWILEVVSYLTPTLNIWNLTDAYNLLIGVSIFLIFVCKKKIYKKLQKRYQGYFTTKPTISKSHTSSSTLESNLSQDVPLQVSNNPKGANGRIVRKEF